MQILICNWRRCDGSTKTACFATWIRLFRLDHWISFGKEITSVEWSLVAFWVKLFEDLFGTGDLQGLTFLPEHWFDCFRGDQLLAGMAVFFYLRWLTLERLAFFRHFAILVSVSNQQFRRFNIFWSSFLV